MAGHWNGREGKHRDLEPARMEISFSIICLSDVPELRSAFGEDFPIVLSVDWVSSCKEEAATEEICRNHAGQASTRTFFYWKCEVERTAEGWHGVRTVNMCMYGLAMSKSSAFFNALAVSQGLAHLGWLAPALTASRLKPSQQSRGPRSKGLFSPNRVEDTIVKAPQR